MEISLDSSVVGKVLYKRFKGLVYEYVNGKQTSKVIGIKIEAESSKQRELFTIKVLNSNSAFIKEVQEKDISLFNVELKFTNLTLYTYKMNGKSQAGYRANSFNVGGGKNGK